MIYFLFVFYLFQARHLDKLMTSETSGPVATRSDCEEKEKEEDASNDSVFTTAASSSRQQDETSDTSKQQQQQEQCQPVNKWCYLHDQSNLPSKATFFWLNPLLWSGYWTPLEQQHLGQLPNEFRAAQLGQELRKCLDRQSANAGGSLWRCYWSFSWPAIVLGGLLKFSGDLVGYVAPLGIQYMVTYLAAQSDNISSNLDSSSSQHDASFYRDPSMSEFISNGYVMAVIVFLASFAQGALSQSSSHVLCVEGIRLKTALQSFMYAKSLRLSSLNGVVSSSDDKSSSSSSDQSEDQNDGPIDAGTCSQLLTEG
jgi:hypothetical protein